MRIELVIFDMDGLMFDTEIISKKAWEIAGERLGYKLDNNVFMEILGTNTQYIKNLFIKKFGDDFPTDEIINERNSLVVKIVEEDGLRVKDGLYELIYHLEQMGIKKAVATSTNRERATELLKKANVYEKFDCIICGDDVKKSKPDPEIFLKAASKLNCKVENCVVLEDSRWGIQAAKSAGMTPVMIPDLLEPDEEMLELIYAKVNTLKEFINSIY